MQRLSPGALAMSGSALDLVRRGAQFDQPGAVDLSQREFAGEVRAPFRFELGRDPEQSFGANLTPIVEAVFCIDLIGRPSVHGAALRYVLFGRGLVRKRSWRDRFPANDI